MDEPQALAAFVALGQEHRLRALRALVTAGPDGMASGVPGRRDRRVAVDDLLPPEGAAAGRADPVPPRGRSIIYSAAYPVLSGLIAFLMTGLLPGPSGGLRSGRGSLSIPGPAARHGGPCLRVPSTS